MRCQPLLVHAIDVASRATLLGIVLRAGRTCQARVEHHRCVADVVASAAGVEAVEASVVVVDSVVVEAALGNLVAPVVVHREHATFAAKRVISSATVPIVRHPELALQWVVPVC